MQPFFVRVFAADGTGKKPLPVTFDAAYAALSELRRLFIEPDGSFVWKSPQGQTPWQVDGTLVDGGDTLYYCELKGTCPPEALQPLLECLLDHATVPAIEMVREGLLVSSKEFSKYLAS